MHTAGVQHPSRFAKLVLILACVSACKPKPEDTAAGSSAGSASAAARQASPPAPSASARAGAAPSTLPEAELKRFVARWEAVQNEHDFAAYSSLYADRFMGVKRVGSYSKRFDRAAWLLDRKPMFEGGAKVRVADLALVAAGGSTRVIFTQEFVSAGFRDTGKKELFLVAAPGGGVQISREEMLSSDVSATSSSDEGVLAYHRDGPVLQRGFDKRALKSPPRLLSSAGASPIEISFEISPEALSAGSRAWLGREVTAYTTRGLTCSGRVARFEARVQAVPHFGMRQSWNGELDAPKASPAEIAKTVEGMAQSEEHFVVGVLDRACAGTWASAASHPFTPAVAAKGLLREAGVAAFKALPSYAELQGAFVKESKDRARAWETVDGELNVVELRAPARPPLLLVSARGGVGCSGFNGALSAFWQIGGSADAPKLTAAAPPSKQYLTLRGAIDQKAAGLALFAGPDGYDDEVAVLRLTPAKAARSVLLSTSFWDCDC